MTQPPGSWRRLYPAGLAACWPHCPGWPYPHSARAPNLDPGPGSACEVAKAVIPWSPGQNPAAWPGPGPAMRPQPGRSQSRSRAESTASRRLVPRAWRLAGRGVTTAPRRYPAILGARTGESQDEAEFVRIRTTNSSSPALARTFAFHNLWPQNCRTTVSVNMRICESDRTTDVSLKL